MHSRRAWGEAPRSAALKPAPAGIRHALIRLVGAVLAEQHDEWTEMRRYIGWEILAKSRLTTAGAAPAEEVTLTAITA